jgi:predicted DNA-binding transcriptional regulator AlpA
MPSATLDIMGLKEIRTLLGVSNTRLHQLKQRDDFPQPIVRLAMGPVYDGATVRAWAAERKGT